MDKTKQKKNYKLVYLIFMLVLSRQLFILVTQDANEKHL